MQKKRLNIFLKDLSASLKKEAATNHPPLKIKNELIKKHSEWVRNTYLSINSDYDETIPFFIIKKNMEQIWGLVQGSMLSYTALPTAAVTQFLIKVAYEALKEHYLKNPTLIQVLLFMMPTLRLEYIVSPDECGYGMADVSIGPLAFEDKQTDYLTIVTHFLQTHLIAESGEYPIPLWVLNKIESEEDATPKNVYYQYDQIYQATNPTQLTTAEYARLLQHNPLTQALAETAKRLNGYMHDKSNLLGQLKLLCNALYFNSKYGVGSEEKAGTTAELAIRSFFDYYKTLKPQVQSTLPQQLQQELKTLRQCIGIYYPGEQPIHLGSTCLATRRQQLIKAIQEQEPLLASIGTCSSSIAKLIRDDKKLLRYQLSTLNRALTTQQLDGHEPLPINKKIITHYSISLATDHLEPLALLLNELSSQEIAESIHPSWIDAIGSLENLVLLFVQLSNEKVLVLSQHLGEKLRSKYLIDPNDYIVLLFILPQDKQNIVAKYFIQIDDRLKNAILPLATQHPQTFKAIWNQLNSTQQLNNANYEKNRLLRDAANQPETLQTILYSFPVELRGEVLHIKPGLQQTTILHYAANNPESLRVILHSLPENQRLDVVRIQDVNGETVLYAAQRNLDSVKSILHSLPQNQQLDALRFENCRVPSVLKSVDTNLGLVYLNKLLDLLPPNERLKVRYTRSAKGTIVFSFTGDTPQNIWEIYSNLLYQHRLSIAMLGIVAVTFCLLCAIEEAGDDKLLTATTKGLRHSFGRFFSITSEDNGASKDKDMELTI